VREGYEGLVRGNQESENSDANTPQEPEPQSSAILHNLRFGDGAQLKDGTGDYPGRRSLKGRYIVRVGWDDVRGWFAEVFLNSIYLGKLLIYISLGRHSHWHSPIKDV
jgi:6-phosphofructokinase 1